MLVRVIQVAAPGNERGGAPDIERRNKMHTTTKAAGAVLLLLFTTGAMAQTVKVNWQENAPFSDYRTYAWHPSKNPGAQFYQQWVRKDVDDELAQKGLQKVDPNQNPDLYLYYHLMSQEVIDSTTTSDGFGFGGGPWGFWGGWGGWGGYGPDIAQTEAEPRMLGILSVDMVDAKKKQLVWRGQATVDAISNSQKGDEKQTLDSVKKMFKKFPPEKKG
jgi:Domain of unknown function (DUF4136)